jgi:hypothetical protein
MAPFSSVQKGEEARPCRVLATDSEQFRIFSLFVLVVQSSDARRVLTRQRVFCRRAEFVDHELLSSLLVEGAADRIKKGRHAAEEKERQDREDAERASLAKRSRRAQKIPRAMPAAAEKTEMWQVTKRGRGVVDLSFF